jgi:hypothetical protein
MIIHKIVKQTLLHPVSIGNSQEVFEAVTPIESNRQKAIIDLETLLSMASLFQSIDFEQYKSGVLDRLQATTDASQLRDMLETEHLFMVTVDNLTILKQQRS